MNTNNIVKFFRDYSTARFFVPLGIILIIFGCFTFVSINNTKNYIKTEAIVSKTELYEAEHYDGETHFDATYQVYVKYTVNEKEYEEEYGIFSDYKEGDKVTISYNPSNPKEITQPNSIVLPIAFIIGGVVSLIVGILSIIKTTKKNKELKIKEEEWKNGK